MNTTCSILLASALLTLMLFSCQSATPSITVEAGVSKTLADHRKATLTNVAYDLTFIIPESQEEVIEGEISIIIDRSPNAGDLILDFKGKAVNQVKMKDEEIPFEFKNEHIVIADQYLNKGRSQVYISFTAGDQALNRNNDFMYALFVPDKASTAFPCFDQPNIKATYNLELGIPRLMIAFSNYSLNDISTVGDVAFYHFNTTLPISTYLFSFGVGYFESITDTIDGREMTLYHRETDEDKVKNNAPICFDLHAKSLAWIEAYTGIPYPFEQFNFALIPAFQFGGMEHPGAIWYRDRSLFLDDNATVNQKMARNSLIAHETAHMWFGDLVTMDWFDDVWLKEVYANFMAAKMVNPNFPEINHELRFLLRHQPSAYGEDRTAGSHAIQQQLDNLNEASLLYGRIIYQKAPVVMKQLESIMGEEIFQEGLQEYLETYAFGNATWDDLIAILDKRTDLNLQEWSQAWVKESSMPHYVADLKTKDGKISRYTVDLVNTTPSGKLWQQKTKLAKLSNGNTEIFDVDYLTQHNAIPISGQAIPDCIIPSVSEQGYGYFQLDEKSQQYLLRNVHNIEDDVIKASAWFSLWEGFLRNKIPVDQMMQTVLTALPYEKDVQGLSSRLGYLRSMYWGFIDEPKRKSEYNNLSNGIWELMQSTSAKGMKKVFYDAFVSTATSDTDIEKLLDLWNEKITIEGLNLSEDDFTKLAYELAVRNVDNSDTILEKQLNKIQNPDRKAEMAFVIPALSSNQNTRDQFFERLKNIENRGTESWILTALQYLHHPLRAKTSEKYILPSLELVQEIQQTGSIFFPQRWVASTLNGHRSAAAVDAFEAFIQSLPNEYPVKLKNKVLMQGDILERKAQIALPD